MNITIVIPVVVCPKQQSDCLRYYRTRTVRGAEYLFHGMSRKESIGRDKKRSTTSSIFILVVGASGDVAKKKIYPALFELYKRYFVPSSSSSLPKSGCTVRIHGFARTKRTTDQFRNQIRYGLKYYRNHGSFFTLLSSTV